MADLIDRKELRDALYESDAVTMQGVKIINQFPAVNAAPLVRCRDCKFRSSWMMNRNLRYICPESGMFPNGENDFCSYGERKDGDGNG